MPTPLVFATGVLKTTVVIPTYNERDNLPVVVAELFALDVEGLDVLVVDDNSPDGTGQVADGLAGSSGGRVAVLHRRRKDGLGRAYVAGMLQALASGAEIVVQMDADLSHPVGSVPQMLRVLCDGDADVVVGSRYVSGGTLDEGWPLGRQLLSRWANRYVARVLRLGVLDSTAGFKAWRAETLRALDLPSVSSSGYSFQIETGYRVNRCGLVTVELPIHFAQRTSGTSKMSLQVQLEAAVVPWRLRHSRWAPTSADESTQPRESSIGRH